MTIFHILLIVSIVLLLSSGVWGILFIIYILVVVAVVAPIFSLLKSMFNRIKNPVEQGDPKKSVKRDEPINPEKQEEPKSGIPKDVIISRNKKPLSFKYIMLIANIIPIGFIILILFNCIFDPKCNFLSLNLYKVLPIVFIASVFGFACWIFTRELPESRHGNDDDNLQTKGAVSNFQKGVDLTEDAALLASGKKEKSSVVTILIATFIAVYVGYLFNLNREINNNIVELRKFDRIGEVGIKPRIIALGFKPSYHLVSHLDKKVLCDALCAYFLYTNQADEIIMFDPDMEVNNRFNATPSGVSYYLEKRSDCPELIRPKQRQSLSSNGLKKSLKVTNMALSQIVNGNCLISRSVMNAKVDAIARLDAFTWKDLYNVKGGDLHPKISYFGKLLVGKVEGVNIDWVTEQTGIRTKPLIEQDAPLIAGKRINIFKAAPLIIQTMGFDLASLEAKVANRTSLQESRSNIIRKLSDVTYNIKRTDIDVITLLLYEIAENELSKSDLDFLRLIISDIRVGKVNHNGYLGNGLLRLSLAHKGKLFPLAESVIARLEGNPGEIEKSLRVMLSRLNLPILKK